jgi:hypothetical protein
LITGVIIDDKAFLLRLATPVLPVKMLLEMTARRTPSPGSNCGFPVEWKESRFHDMLSESRNQSGFNGV